MADGVAITPGAGVTVGTDEVTGLTPTLSALSHVQFAKIVDATPDSVNKWKVEADGAARVVGDSVATVTVTSVASSATAVTIAAANAARRMLYVFNFSTADLYLKLGSGAAFSGTPSFLVRVPPSGYWEMPSRPIYTGLISGIWSSVNGSALVTEG